MQKRPFKQPDSSPVSVDSQSLLINSTHFYLILGGVGLLVCYYQYDSLATMFALPGTWSEASYLFGLGVLGAGVLIILGYVFEEYFVTFKSLRMLMMRFMGRLPLWVSFYIAIISSVAKEILFRGAIQPAVGLFITSLLFGLLHLSPANGISSWSMWAVVAGLLFGWMYEETQSLWPPLFAHVLVNSYSMLRFRLGYRRLQKLQAEQKKKPIPGAND
ncbi:MAG: CPBP family intramembrane glutamic endopeptidase [Oligoflexus sp.]